VATGAIAIVSYAQFKAVTLTKVFKAEVSGLSPIFRAVGVGDGFTYILAETTKPASFDTDFPSAVLVDKLVL
jgi:hypothetical protein